ncbi:MAG TPA: response regulator transcription factor [Pseudonocardiaceae bacterium]|nr:response regulator transcription factor [Pseudonocardiaceae bacterium]
MERVRVGVQASDPITSVGVANCLDSRAEIMLLPSIRPAELDVLVLAADLVNAEIIGMIRKVARESSARTVLLTGDLAETDLLTAVEYRVVAVLPRRTTTPDQLVDAVLAASNGAGVLPPDLLGSLLAQVRRLREEMPMSDGLTPREVDVLRLLAEGLDTAQIAERLCYAERTVKNVLYAVLSRLNLRNRPHAVAYAMRAGLI